MRFCYRILAVLVVLCLASFSSAGQTAAVEAVADAGGGTRGDIHFHASTLNAYGGALSWYCGVEDLTSDGGYGNNWLEYLELPPIDIYAVPVREVSWGTLKSGYLTGQRSIRSDRSDFPVVTFAYRTDTEWGDYAILQYTDGGVWYDLSGILGGNSHGWEDVGAYGYNFPGEYDTPLRIRFKVVTDDAVSDEDGGYDSAGGAVSLDNVRVYDFITGKEYFLDDVESGGLCTPSAL